MREEPKTFAQLIAELSADHERFVATIEPVEQHFNAWSARIAELRAEPMPAWKGV